MKRILLIPAAVAITVVFSTIVAFAHGGATGIVKERMEVMDQIGDAMKALTAMMRGKETYDAARVRTIAATIEDHGGKALTDLFPHDSMQKPSEALPSIWRDWDRFSALAEELSNNAKALGMAADNQRGGPGGAGGPMGGGTGMMGGGQGAMMGGGQGMMGGGQGMMGGTAGAPDAAALAQMPPDASFFHLTQTCAACHQDFRKKK